MELQSERMMSDIPLTAIAEVAGVSVQTILRQFGSRDGLFDATVEFAAARMAEERRTPPGDPAAAVDAIFNHYEQRGDSVLLALAQENTEHRMAAVTAMGKRFHREWVGEAFTPLIADRPDADELIDLLVVATDVYTWKLLRRDRGLTRADAQRRVLRLITALLEAP